MTQLCTVPGCRIRGSHLPGCDDAQCAGCLPRATDEGYACDACVRRATDQLAEIAVLAPDARLVAAGLVRRGSGGTGGKPGSRPPLNDGATDALDEVTNTITTIARDIAETRGLQSAQNGRTLGDPLARACSWLSGQMRWLRHALDDQGGAYAATVFPEIGDSVHRMRSIVDGPRAPKYLGPCGAPVDARIEHGPADANGSGAMVYPAGDCEGDVYGPAGGAKGTCRTCGAQVSQDERRAWLDAEVRGWAFRASEIANAYSVNVKTIRSWADRGHLAEHGRDRDDRPLYNLGDVLDLAAADAARRETDRAKRERRAAERAEEARAA